MAMKQLAPHIESVRRIMGRIIGGTKRCLEDKKDLISKVTAAWGFNTAEVETANGSSYQVAAVSRHCAIEWGQDGLQRLGATSVEIMTAARRR